MILTSKHTDFSAFYSGDYRYAFNGMERDDEVKGEGNSYDFGARIYDPRVGRWLSRDAMEYIYTGVSPYTSMGNSPINIIDIQGNFIIDPKDPNAKVLQQFIETAKQFLIANPNLIYALEKYANLSVKELDIIFTDGKGPVLRVGTSAEVAESVAAQFQYFSGRIVGIGDGLYSGEVLLGPNSLNNLNSFFNIISLLHELVHLGDISEDQISENIDYTGVSKRKMSNINYTVESLYPELSQKRQIEPGVAWEHIATGGYEVTESSYNSYKNREARKEKRANDKKIKKQQKQVENGGNWDTRPPTSDEQEMSNNRV